LNKQDFIDWKRHPVTQVIFSQLSERVRLLQESLGDTAGENPLSDRFSVGAIQAYKDMLLMDFEVDEETQ